MTGTAILHVDFLGMRHGAFVTADETGMVFVHHLSRKFVVANITTTRILGRYPERLSSAQRPVKPHKPSCVLGMASLPLGGVKFITDEMQLVAMLSPYKVITFERWTNEACNCIDNTIRTDSVTRHTT